MRRHGADERGSATIGITLFGLVAMTVVAGLADRVATEHRAIEESLAQVRLHWAAMGHATYLLSRIREAGPCGKYNNCSWGHGDLLKGGEKIMQELGPVLTWRYPELGTAYRFQLTTALQESAEKGRWRLRIGFGPVTGVTPPDALRVVARARPLQLRYCLVDAEGDPCNSAGDDVQAVFQKITSVHRAGP